MGKSSQSNGGGTNLASCMLATFFLILLLIAAFTVYFILFKPKDPKLAVNAVRLPVFSAVNSTVTFNFTQYVTVHNPNRAEFTHYDSSLQLIYAGYRVGLLFVPAGKIAAGRTQYMTATFSVQSLSVSGSGRPDNGIGLGGFRPGPSVDVETRPEVSGQPDDAGGLNGFGGFRAGPGMEVETKLEMAGRVRVLRLFTHHVEAKVDCRVAIGVSDGSILGLRC